jgi:SAM-dependent methyltransferase
VSPEAVHQSAELWEFVERWLPEPPVRVLDVGCGPGESTRRLRELGHEAIGVDPEAPAEPGFTRSTLESFHDPHPFAGAVAIRSLHHLNDLDTGVDVLARSLAEGAHLILFEFVVESVDDAAREWLRARSLVEPIKESHVHEVISLEALRHGLERRFRVLADEPVPYLAREAGRPEHEAAERQAIAAGELRPAGIRLAYALG